MTNGQVKARNPAIAGLLSFLVPGLGQVYNGQLQLAAFLAVTTYASAMTAGVKAIGALGAADPRPLVTGVLFWVGVATLAWLGGVVLAVFGALDRPDYELQSFNHPAVYLGSLLLFLVLLPLLGGGPLLRWMLARNGIRTPDEVQAWVARLEAIRARDGAPGGRGPAEGTVVVPNIEVPEPEDPAELSRNASTVIHLVLVGGQDGGVYDVYSSEPTCTYVRGDSASWANLYTNPADSTGITAVQLRIQTDIGTTRAFQLSVNVGNLPQGRNYVADGRRNEPGEVPASATVERRGAGAVLRLVGTTADQVRIEATVQCRVLKAG